jgi:hypothetical protein
MRRRPRWIWALTLMAALGFEQARADPVAPEYQVKAAFLYKFATYIHWPEPTGKSTAPFVVGIIGRDPFGSSLGAVVRGQTVHGKTIVIRKLARVEEALQCDVLFISSSEREHLPQILGALGSAPVLTVSDMDQFAERGGMINLITTEDNHIRFDINKAAIDRAGLKAPSQLLRLARIVNASLASGEGR